MGRVRSAYAVYWDSDHMAGLSPGLKISAWTTSGWGRFSDSRSSFSSSRSLASRLTFTAASSAGAYPFSAVPTVLPMNETWSYLPRVRIDLAFLIGAIRRKAKNVPKMISVSDHHRFIPGAMHAWSHRPNSQEP